MEEFLLERDAQTIRQGVDDPEPDIVTSTRVALARIPEAEYHESQELLLFFLGLLGLLGTLDGFLKDQTLSPDGWLAKLKPFEHAKTVSKLSTRLAELDAQIAEIAKQAPKQDILDDTAMGAAEGGGAGDEA